MQHSNGEKMVLETEEMTPEERNKLLKELRQRLKEVQELKEALNMKPEEEKEKEKENEENTDSQRGYSIGKMKEELEELKVPPLELLDDFPFKKKEKKQEETK